jgi:hypothetical protein
MNEVGQIEGQTQQAMSAPAWIFSNGWVMSAEAARMMILLNSTNTRFESEGESKSGTCDVDSEMTEGVDF